LQSLYDPFLLSMYTPVFASSFTIPIIGSFDRDVSAEIALNIPQMYRTGQRDYHVSFMITILTIIA
jgi:hypothetical protein